MRRRAADLRKFDSLGPLTRQVIRDSPKDMDVEPMLRAFMQARSEMLSRAGDDIEVVAARFDAGRDKAMADFVLSEIRKRFPEWAGPI